MYLNTTSTVANITLYSNRSLCYPIRGPRNRLFLYFYAALITVAIPSNIFSLYVSWQYIRDKNELGVYLFSLALSDLAYALGLSMFLELFKNGAWLNGGFHCVLSIIIHFTNFYTSDAFLCCIALNRYLAVVHPLQYISLRKVSTAVAVSACIWVLVIGFNIATINLEDVYNKESNLCLDVSIPHSDTFREVNIARFFLGFLLPILLVVFSTWGICRAVQSSQATDDQERKRVFKLLTVILLCILLCLGPVHVSMVVYSTVTNCENTKWLLYIGEISGALSSLNCIVDPLLYCFITRKAKANLNQLVLLFKVRKRSTNENVV